MKDLGRKIGVIIVVVIVLCLVIYYLSMAMLVINSFAGSRGSCWYRYSLDNSGAMTSQVFSSNKTVMLQANGNYNGTTADANGQVTVAANQGTYGQWLKVMTVTSPSLTVEISGTVSLCKSYIPAYDLQNYSSSASTTISYPRAGESNYVGLRFPASSATWRNAAEVFAGDQIQLLVGPAISAANSSDQTQVTMTDAFTGQSTAPVNCNDSGNSAPITANAICGRFSPYYNISYVTGCNTVTTYSCNDFSCTVALGPGQTTCHPSLNSNNDCRFNPRSSCDISLSWSNDCSTGDQDYIVNDHRQTTISYSNITSAAPPPYDPAGSNIFVYSHNLSDYLKKSTYMPTTSPCINATSDATVIAAAAGYKFWLTQGQGLKYQISTTPNAAPGAAPNSFSPGDNQFPATLNTPASTPGTNTTPPGKILYSTTITSDIVSSSTGTGMLQLGYINDGSASDNTGGYVIYVNHTKCVRSDGQKASDTFTDRGRIDYYLAPAQYDLNNLPSGINTSSFQSGNLDFSNSSTATISNSDSENALNLWVRVNNNVVDYPDSQGQYTLKIGQMEAIGLFTSKVIMPIVASAESMIESTGTTIFKNLTCYGRDTGKCTDFFMYIKALLTLYIFMFGLMFLLGKIELNQKEFFSHSIRVILIGGLLNGSTFNYLNTYVFPSLMSFSDQIIANFGGYSAADPFTFLDEAMNNLLFNKTSLFQMFALISGGLTGIAMFILTAVAISIFMGGVFKALSTYIFAKLLVAFLIGIGPLFLTFMLFEPTRSFFQKWLNSLIKYTLEPIIVIMGLAIFTKLFVVYLDSVLGYSVCFKCAIPFKMPSILATILPGFPSAFTDIIIFCFYWFAPWGVDSRMGLIGLSMPDVIGLGLVAYMNYTYVDFSPSIVNALTSVGGASASGLAAKAGASSGGSMVTMEGLQKLGKYSLNDAKKRGIIKTGGGLEAVGDKEKPRDHNTHEAAEHKANPEAKPQATEKEKDKMVWHDNPLYKKKKPEGDHKSEHGEASAEQTKPADKAPIDPKVLESLKYYKSDKLKSVLPAKRKGSKGAATGVAAGASSTSADPVSSRRGGVVGKGNGGSTPTSTMPSTPTDTTNALRHGMSNPLAAKRAGVSSESTNIHSGSSATSPTGSSSTPSSLADKGSSASTTSTRPIIGSERGGSPRAVPKGEGSVSAGSGTSPHSTELSKSRRSHSSASSTEEGATSSSGSAIETSSEGSKILPTSSRPGIGGGKPPVSTLPGAPASNPLKKTTPRPRRPK